MAEKQGELEKKEKKPGKKRKEAFIYGNYRSYYGYRIGQSMSEDPRLALMKNEWFEGKDCLDIGCNEGLVTIAVATKFCCRSILGVDIDSGLIENANWNLRRVARMENSGGKYINLRTKDLPKRANGQNYSTSVNEMAADASRDLSISQEPTVLKRVSFKKENIVQNLNPCEKYDTILCLSVTKWIHLNWGDEGLIGLFAKIWRLLQPGGILILEPQPWKSYKRKHSVSEVTRCNYAQILLKPHVFQEILLDKIGFRTVEMITKKTPGSVAGFDRPIYIYRK